MVLLPAHRAQAVHDGDRRDREYTDYRDGKPSAYQQLNDPDDDVRHDCPPFA
jgi:hypothetical protein